MRQVSLNLYQNVHSAEDELEELFKGEVLLRRASVQLYVSKSAVFSWMQPALGSLVELSLSGRVQPLRLVKLPFADVFGKLVNLESLSWGLTDLPFTTSGTTAVAAKAFLPKLEKITVTACHPSFWTATSRCGCVNHRSTVYVVLTCDCDLSLPLLRSLSLNSGVRKAESFLHAHGRKITHLVVSNGLKQADMAQMPNLTVLQLQAVRLKTRSGCSAS